MKIDQKLYKPMGMIAAGFIVLILFIALIAACSRPKKVDADNMYQLEARLIEVAQRYYSTRESSLPKEGNKITLSVASLVEEGYIRPLESLIVRGDECTATITVMNNNGFYLYLPKINCGSRYSPKNLSEEITQDANLVTTGNGLYLRPNGYIFRGEDLNNHLEFAGKLWHILRVNTDGSLRIMEIPRRDSIVWDDRFNIERNSTLGINDYIAHNINSRIKDSIEAIYEDEDEFNDNERAHFIPQDLCIGKRSEEDTGFDGSIECSNKLDNQILSIIATYEFMQASLDPECITILDNSCENYNYLAFLTPTFWTITANADTTDRIFKISRRASSSIASTSASLKIVAHLTSEVLFSSGDGSIENPFRLISSK